MSGAGRFPRLTLKPGRDKSLRRRHPWVFSGAVERVEEGVRTGDGVALCDANGEVLGHGFYSASSEIRARLFSFGDTPPDLMREVARRLERACDDRARDIREEETNVFRLVNAEGDRLPGLFVDRYDSTLVVQPVAPWLQRIAGELPELLLSAARRRFPVASLRYRLEPDALKREGFSAEGFLPVGETAGRVVVRENGLRVPVDLEQGQKTGFYCDQRENRKRLRDAGRLGRGLNLFGYTGGFTLAALQGGASEVLTVDQSAPALQLLKEALALNGFDPKRAPVLQGDVKEVLPEQQRRNERFDFIICDPPPLARRPDHVVQAARAYKDINRRALSLIERGDLLTFSCSAFVDPKLFRQILFQAAGEAGRDVRVIGALGPGPDHPADLYHPEGEYLKGLWLRVAPG